VIKHFRPDISIDRACDVVRNALTGKSNKKELLKLSGGRQLFFTPSARQGLTWFLTAAGLIRGDEVAVPALICPAVGEAIAAAGLRIVVFGNNLHDFSPSVELCGKSLGPSTRAVILPHLFGRPGDLTGFRELCSAEKLLLIEDCAPCINGVGDTGDAAIYSFGYGKPLSLGYGGALTMNADKNVVSVKPFFRIMTPQEDRILTAAFIILHILSDSDFYNSRVSPEAALSWLCQTAHAADDILNIICDTGTNTRSCLMHVCRQFMLQSPEQDGMFGKLSKRVWRGTKKLLFPVHPPRPDPLKMLLRGTSLLPGGCAMDLLLAQYVINQEGDASAWRQKIARIYTEKLSHRNIRIPAPLDSQFSWTVFPCSFNCSASERDRRCFELSSLVPAEIGPYNWPTPLHRVPYLRSVIRTGPELEDTVGMIEGLINLPVHSMISEELAEEIAVHIIRIV